MIWIEQKNNDNPWKKNTKKEPHETSVTYIAADTRCVTEIE